MGKGRRKQFSQRAMSPVISVTVMTGLIIAMGIATLAWAHGVSLNFLQGSSSAINADIDRLKERLTTKYVNYDPTKELTIHLINVGTIDDVAIQSVTIRSSDGTIITTSSKPTLKLFDGSVVPCLDQREEGYIELGGETVVIADQICGESNYFMEYDIEGYEIVGEPVNLTPGEYYFVTIVTKRGAVFNAEFVA